MMQNRQIKISDFDTLRVLGRGGFGKVKLAKHQKSQKHYAIQTLEKVFLCKNQAYFNFWVERDIMSMSNSPWLMQLHYAFQDEINLYMVMDFMPGGELLNLARRKMTEDEIRFYAAEMVLAVEALHDMDYIHGDVKLENLLIGHDGHLKLSDFGLSLKLNSLGEACLKFAVGTPDKLPIEVLTHSYRGKISDWCSIGVSIYEMISGNSPFPGHNYFEILYKMILFLGNPGFPGVEMSEEAQNLLLSLMTTIAWRLGATGAWEIKQQSFFNSLQWNFATIHAVRPPFVPELDTDYDCKYIHYEGNEEIEMASRPTHINHLFFVDYKFFPDLQKECQSENLPATSQNNQNSKVHEKISTLENQNGELWEDKYDLKDQNSRLQEKISVMEKQNNKLQEEKSNLEDQNHELQKKVSALENQNHELQEDTCDLEIQNYELKEKIFALKNQNLELQKDKCDLEDQNLELQEKMCALENENYKLQVEKCDLEDQHYELQEKMSALKSTKLHEEKCDLENQNTTLHEKNLQNNKTPAQIFTLAKGFKEICGKVMKSNQTTMNGVVKQKNKKELEKMCDVKKGINEKLPSLSQVNNWEKELNPKRTSKKETSHGKQKAKQELESLCVVDESGRINCMGHDFVKGTYRTPRKCACCSQDLWNLFRTPLAVKCNKCHLRFHQHHLDGEDEFILMCTASNMPNSQLPDEPPAEGSRTGPAPSSCLKTLIEKMKNKKQARYNPSRLCQAY